MVEPCPCCCTMCDLSAIAGSSPILHIDARYELQVNPNIQPGDPLGSITPVSGSPFGLFSGTPALFWRDGTDACRVAYRFNAATPSLYEGSAIFTSPAATYTIFCEFEAERAAIVNSNYQATGMVLVGANTAGQSSYIDLDTGLPVNYTNWGVTCVRQPAYNMANTSSKSQATFETLTRNYNKIANPAWLPGNGQDRMIIDPTGNATLALEIGTSGTGASGHIMSGFRVNSQFGFTFGGRGYVPYTGNIQKNMLNNYGPISYSKNYIGGMPSTLVSNNATSLVAPYFGAGQYLTGKLFKLVVFANDITDVGTKTGPWQTWTSPFYKIMACLVNNGKP